MEFVNIKALVTLHSPGFIFLLREQNLLSFRVDHSFLDGFSLKFTLGIISPITAILNFH